MHKPFKQHHRIRAILDARMLRRHRFTPAQVAFLREQGIVPGMSGGDEDDSGDDDSSDDAGDDNESGAGSDEEGSGDSEDKPKSRKKDDDADLSDDATMATLPRSEIQRLRRIAREHDEAEKKRKKELEETARKKKREEGRWEELLQEERDKTATAEKERDEAKGELQDFRRRLLVEKVAKRLGYRDPADAYLFIENEDMDDEKLSEAALKKVARDKDYLIDKKKGTGVAGGVNGGSAGGFSIEQIRNMSQEEINANWSKPGFQETLQNSGVG